MLTLLRPLGRRALVPWACGSTTKVTIDSARRVFAMCAKGTIDGEARASETGQERLFPLEPKSGRPTRP